MQLFRIINSTKQPFEQSTLSLLEKAINEHFSKNQKLTEFMSSQYGKGPTNIQIIIEDEETESAFTWHADYDQLSVKVSLAEVALLSEITEDTIPFFLDEFKEDLRDLLYGVCCAKLVSDDIDVFPNKFDSAESFAQHQLEGFYQAYLKFIEISRHGVEQCGWEEDDALKLPNDASMEEYMEHRTANGDKNEFIDYYEHIKEQEANFSAKKDRLLNHAENEIAAATRTISAKQIDLENRLARFQRSKVKKAEVIQSIYREYVSLADEASEILKTTSSTLLLLKKSSDLFMPTTNEHLIQEKKEFQDKVDGHLKYLTKITSSLDLLGKQITDVMSAGNQQHRIIIKNSIGTSLEQSKLDIIHEEFESFLKSNPKSSDLLRQCLNSGDITLRVVSSNIEQLSSANWSRANRVVKIALPAESSELINEMHEDDFRDLLRNNRDTFSAALFELCNVNNDAINNFQNISSFSNAHEYAEALERAEHNSVIAYNEIVNYGNQHCNWRMQEVYSDQQVEDVDYNLAVQEELGHTENYRKQYEQAQQLHRTKEVELPETLSKLQQEGSPALREAMAPVYECLNALNQFNAGEENPDDEMSEIVEKAQVAVEFAHEVIESNLDKASALRSDIESSLLSYNKELQTFKDGLLQKLTEFEQFCHQLQPTLAVLSNEIETSQNAKLKQSAEQAPNSPKFF